MLSPLGIKVFNLCIQTNSLWSLIDFDLGISLGNLMYSSICIIILGLVWSLWLWKCLAIVVLLLCLISNIWPWNLSMILFFGLTYILYVVPVALQTIYEIVTLACAFSDCIVGCIVVQIWYFPWLGNPVQYWQVLGLVHPFGVVLLGCGIFALTNRFFNEGDFLYVIMMSCLPISLVALDLPR